MARLVESLVGIGVAVVFVGCKDEPKGVTVCTDDIRPAIIVELVDARTDQAPGKQKFMGIAVDGEFTDSTRTFPPLTFAEERPGVYDVVVRGEGYKLWTAEDVTVTEGVCHVNTVELVARVEPSG
jgi:hypothetical protein